MRRRLVVPALAGLLVLTGACGAKEDTATTPTTAVSRSSSDGDATTTTTEASSGDEGGTSDSSMPDLDRLDSLPGDLGACAQAATVYSAILSQASVIFTPGADTAELDEALAQLDEVKSELPEDVAGAFEVWSDAWTQFAQELDDIASNGGMLDPANAERLEEASAILETPEVEEASQTLDAYFEETCGTIGS